MNGYRRKALLTLSLLAGLTVLATSPATTFATYPGADGRIAFSQDHPSEGYGAALFSIEPDGTDLRQLTDMPGFESNPRWSADGQWITFTRLVSEDGTQIYTMRADGSEQRPVVHVGIDDVGDAQGISPTFTPSGNRIVYSTRAAIRSTGVDGMGSETIYRVPEKLFGRRCCVSDPTVSPDGKLIAFVRHAPRLRDSGLWTMNRNGKDLRHLSSPPKKRGLRSPDFSPDGKHIYVNRGFERGGAHLIMRLDGSRQQQLPGLSNAAQVSLAPSGNRLVGQDAIFTNDGLQGCGYLFTQSLTGADRFRLTANCQTPSDVTAAWPSWQPIPAP